MCFGRAVIITKSPNVVVFLLSAAAVAEPERVCLERVELDITVRAAHPGGFKKKEEEHIDLLDSFLMVNKFGMATWH